MLYDAAMELFDRIRREFRARSRRVRRRLPQACQGFVDVFQGLGAAANPRAARDDVRSLFLVRPLRWTDSRRLNQNLRLTELSPPPARRTTNAGRHKLTVERAGLAGPSSIRSRFPFSPVGDPSISRSRSRASSSAASARRQPVNNPPAATTPTCIYRGAGKWRSGSSPEPSTSLLSPIGASWLMPTFLRSSHRG